MRACGVHVRMARQGLPGTCRILIASIMEEYDRKAWENLITMCEDAGVDAFEINFSCPHGMPERRILHACGAFVKIRGMQPGCTNGARAACVCVICVNPSGAGLHWSAAAWSRLWDP